jgi:uncharacterized DUF497 family protein
MNFEWDETKRALNLLKHGLDFADAILLLDGDHLILPTHPGSDEARFKAIGRIGPHDLTPIYTERDNAIRVISLRTSRDGERRQHQAQFGG